MDLIITYKNSREDVFEEKHLDCAKLTIRGHASKLIDAWKTQQTGMYAIDNYNAVFLDEIISIRVV